MNVNAINSVNFTHKHLIKTYFLEGKLPTVTKGFYGGELTKDTVTIEHLRPISKGGKTELKNVVLAENVRNWSRSNKPLSCVFDEEAFKTYCKEFEGIKLPFFNGDNYIKQITRTIERLLKQGK